MIFKTIDQHCDYMIKMASAKPDKVLISSFGIYAGIMPNGDDIHLKSEKYHNRIHDVFDSLVEVPSVQVLVGVPSYIECIDYCSHCAEKYIRNMIRTHMHSKRWNYSWKFSTELHLKCSVYIWKNLKRAIVGGRNMTNSSFADLSMLVKDEQVIDNIIEMYNTLWNESLDINQSNIDDLIIKQDVDKRCR